MRICYILASRQRQDRFFDTLDNLRSFSNSKDYFVLAKLDYDDSTMNNEGVKGKLSRYPEVKVKWGISKSKIHAINRANQEAQEAGIIICLSDDQKFTVKGYDDIIRENMPEDLDAFLHFTEPFSKDRVCILSILGRNYFNRFGFIYHQDYYSLWADNEATETAKILDKYILINKEIFTHFHYSQNDPNKKIAKDLLYQRNDTYRQDERIFNARKEINFDL